MLCGLFALLFPGGVPACQRTALEVLREPGHNSFVSSGMACVCVQRSLRVLSHLRRLLEELGAESSPRKAPRGLSRLLAVATAAPAGPSSSGSSAGGPASRQQRPWDSWSLPALPASQQQARRKAKLSGVTPPAAASHRAHAPAGTPSTVACPPFSPLAHSTPPCIASQPAQCCRPVASAGLLWEVGVDLAWLGLSVVGAAQEVAYLRASGLKADVRGTAAHLMLDLELRQVQVCVRVCVGAWGWVGG